MQIQFLNDGTEYRSHGGSSFSKTQQSSGLFWWTILITLLMGAAIFCWFFSIVLFSHPEKPLHYRLLAKVKKLEPLRKFSPLSVPQGKFLTAREVLGEYFNDSPDHLAVGDDQLKRAYIKNYKEQAPKYVKDGFTVIAGCELKDTDVFTKGWGVRAWPNYMRSLAACAKSFRPSAASARSTVSANTRSVLAQVDARNSASCTCGAGSGAGVRCPEL